MQLSDALQRYWIAGSDAAMSQRFAAKCRLPAAQKAAKMCPPLRKRVLIRAMCTRKAFSVNQRILRAFERVVKTAWVPY